MLNDFEHIDQKYSFSNAISWQVADNIFIIQHEINNQLYAFDQVAFEICHALMVHGEGVISVINKLSIKYEIPKEVIRDDVLQFLNSMVEKGLMYV
ncbi:MAG: PqqD family protein [Lachnospiraceae bacterium]|jgi:hypothetical protein|nr:PqqD family protein [Lachnospiraceae bacterium]